MDPISNMLIKIKNAKMAHHERVLVPFSKIKFSIAQILNKAGYVTEIEKKKKKIKKSELPFLELKISGSGAKEISGIKIVSKPSRRMYSGSREIRPIKNGYGLSVVSTSKGLMTDTDARKARLGGEMLFEIW